MAFAEAIVSGAQTLARSRTSLIYALGTDAMVDAAGVVSNFERMVRIADSTGIELGDRLEQGSADVRDALSISRPAGR